MAVGLKILLSFLILFFLGAVSYAQVSNLRCKKVPVNTYLAFDTLTIDPSSVQIIDKGDFILKVDSASGDYGVFAESPEYNQVEVCYRVFPFNLSERYYRRDLETYDSTTIFKEISEYEDFVIQREELFKTPGLTKTGSISRGVSFGNRQNVFVNSNLNLQLEGKLSDDINITAVISDQNIPFQPEGNTQQLQEFDRVYIQLSTKRSRLTAGDIVLRQQEPYFLKYFRNLQGGQFETNYGKDSSSMGTFSFGAAVSKGKFSSNQVEPIEGVLGPYRLNGPNNERFIIILANSERVYLDGKLLKRGFNYDYVIDYNQSEITFTNNVVITKFSRIRVDFEYSDRNYSRVTLNASEVHKEGNTQIYGHFYREQDNRNAPIITDLETEDKIALSEIGDDLDNALVPGVDTVEFSADRILYKSDTITENGTEIPIYVQSTNPDSAIYQVSFSDVGQGNGDYIKDNTTRNGTVFEYAGQGEGRYLPLRAVPTPKKKQMIVTGSTVDISGHDRVYVELAVSDNDKNLFSELDDDDNRALAVKGGYINKGKPIFDSAYVFTSSIDFEYDDANFTPIDRFRYVEFDRDWSADPNVQGRENIFNSSVGIVKDADNQALYTLSYRNKKGDVNGYQHRAVLNKQFGNFYLRNDFFTLINENDLRTSNWDRFKSTFFMRSKYFEPGVTYELDKNRVFNSQGEIQRTAMNFDQYTAFLKSNDTLDTKFLVEYIYREDNDTSGTDLKLLNVAHMGNASLETQVSENTMISSRFTYRNLANVRDPDSEENEENITGRVNLTSRILDNAIIQELTYFAGTGRDLRREFIFIEVPSGEGTHIFLGDLNDNSVKDLDEFSEKIFSDTVEYIKSFIPTDDFVKSFTNQFDYRVNVQAPRSWAKKEGIRKFATRVSNTSSVSVNKKLTNNDFAKRFIPFTTAIANENLLSIQENIRSTMFFNRANPKYGMDLTYAQLRRKQFLSGGFDSTGQRNWTYNARLNIQRIYVAKLSMAYLQKENKSDFLTNRNYFLQTLEFNPELSFQPSQNARLSGFWVYRDKSNRSGPERATVMELGLRTRLSKAGSRNIDAEIKYIKITDNQGPTFASTPLGFEMLGGLREGNNWTMMLNFQQRLSNGLQLNANYEGRKSEENPFIHIGRMQVTALF